MAKLFILGAVFGTLGDAMHVLGGAIGYNESALNALKLPITGQPWWVPPQFGFACIIIGYLQIAADTLLWRATGRTPERYGATASRHMVVGCIAILAAWGASAFLPLATGGGMDVLLALGTITLWFVFDRSFEGLFLMMFIGIAGVAGEYFNSSSGNFFYTPAYTNLLGVVPSWLPWLYASSAIVVGNYTRFLRRAS